MKLNIIKLWNSLVITFFLCSERLSFMEPIDDMKIKHYWVLLTLLLSVIILNQRKLKNIKEYTPVIACTLILYLISLAYQFRLSEFKMFSVREVYFFLVPLAFVFVLNNVTVKSYNDYYIDLIFIVSIFLLGFVVINSKTLSWENIKGLFSWRALLIESESTLKESDLGVFFTLFYIYYYYSNQKTKRIIAFICCFVSYKRIAVLFVILGAFFFKFFDKHKAPKKTLYYGAIVIFILAPFAVYYMCEDSFSYWFYQNTGLDFNRFTMSRFEIINAVIDSNITNYGLGTVSNFLEQRGRAGQLNMHNDILKIYMECGLVGTIVFTTAFYRITRDNNFKFIIMVFTFLELFGAHFLGSGSISYWVITYLMLIQITKREEAYKEKQAQESDTLSENLEKAST